MRSSKQPGIVNEACGIYFSEFTIPENVSLKTTRLKWAKKQCYSNMDGALHPPLQKCWHGTTILHGEIRGHYGKQLWQRARYLYRLHDKRCAAAKIIQDAVTKAGLWGTDQQLAFPIITKFGVNQRGKTVHYYFNYSASPVHFTSSLRRWQ